MCVCVCAFVSVGKCVRVCLQWWWCVCVVVVVYVRVVSATTSELATIAIEHELAVAATCRKLPLTCYFNMSRENLMENECACVCAPVGVSFACV